MDKVGTEELVTLDSDALAVATNDLRVAMMIAGRSPIETPWEAIAKAVIRSYVKALSESGWRDITTAPKDGTTILAYFPLDGLTGNWCRIVPVQFHGSNGWIFASRAASGFSRDYQPTHWQPLPTPPEAKTP